MFANTYALVVGSVTYNLNRVNQDQFGSEYTCRSVVGELVTLKFRHSVDVVAGRRYLRHNIFIEWKVFATPVTAEKLRTLTYTVRQNEEDDPAKLTELSSAMLTFISGRDDGLILGEN